ncbi:MAG: glycine cleavage system aminomethyltransferase GcvT [Euryarchaeota archaeon]|nr:glycine cleavage system aminomethyltransferase GcvT [Euryarchaeota archaeon]
MRRTPLYEEHVSAGARMVDFAGWEMPIQYQGIIDEHMAVRNAAGIFDVSHMGDVLISGPTAKDLLLKLLTNDISKLPVSKAIYAHFLNEQGKIMDDTIVYRLGEEEYLLIPNASTTGTILDWIGRHRTDQTVVDVSSRVACIALQGPASVRILQTLTEDDVSSIGHFTCRAIDLGLPSGDLMWGGKVLAARTGYTGEDGFELMLDASLAASVWRRILSEGRQDGVVPAGLGCRDTLRLEMGYLLSGTDFDGTQSSVQTGPSWVVKWDHDFIGRDALKADSERKDLPKLVCIELRARGIPRHGYPIEFEGKAVGHITSGTFSPSLKRGISMGYLPPELAREGQALDVVIRQERVPAEVIRAPFLKKR